MNKHEKYLEEAAKYNMKQFDLDEFKKTHPSLYSTIIKALELQEADFKIIQDMNKSNFPSSSIPEFGSDGWIKACDTIFGGRPNPPKP